MTISTPANPDAQGIIFIKNGSELFLFDDAFTETIDSSSQHVKPVDSSDNAKYNMATRYGAHLENYIFGTFFFVKVCRSDIVFLRCYLEL